MDFQPGFHLFLGNNGQGKTNILEAIYLVATLRSFRGAGGAELVRHGQTGYFIGVTVLSDIEHKCRIYWSREKKSISLDARPIRRVSDYLGVLRAVVFSTDDLQLVKGPASRRRRFLRFAPEPDSHDLFAFAAAVYTGLALPERLAQTTPTG